MRELRDQLAFVRAHTAPAPVPLVPELSLYQATELTPLWQATAEEPARPDPAPFWAFPWPGGQALARHILDAPELVRGRRVFDFATGSGLVAIAAARAGAARVLACDVDPLAGAAVELNAALNGVEVAFRLGDPRGEPLDGFDVLLAGDVFYERALATGSIAWFAALAASGLLVLAGDPGRLYSPRSGTVERARYDVRTSREIESAPVRRTWILELTPAASPDP